MNSIKRIRRKTDRKDVPDKDRKEWSETCASYLFKRFVYVKICQSK